MTVMPPVRMSRTEQELMVRLWKRGPSSIRELTDLLYPGGTHSEYATVQSLLDRLVTKGYARREKQGRVNIYHPRVGRRELLGQRLRDLADSLCEGSWAPLVSQLVEVSNPTPEEAEALERLVERLTLDVDVDEEQPSK